MESKMFLCLNLILSSWVFVGFSQIPSSLGSDSGSLTCVQKLLPCQPYLHKPSSPPSSCCGPLKDMITVQPQCLCDIFNNPQILTSLSVSKEDGLALLKACDANADVSVCNKSADSNSTAPAPAPAPSTVTPVDAANGSSSGSSPSSSPSGNSTKSAATEISHFGGIGFIAIFLSLFV